MAEIKVMSASAIKPAFLELAAGFERATGNTVVTNWMPTGQIMSRIKGDETTDLIVIESGRIDELIKLGKLTGSGRADVAKSTVGAAVRAGAPRPDISSATALKNTFIAAKSIVYSGGPSGTHLLNLIQRMGIADELKSKLKQAQNEPTGAVVARGEAELAFQQVCELLPVGGIDFLGPLSPDTQHVTVLSAGIHMGAKQPDAARKLIEFMTAPAAAAVFRKHGLEPG